MQSSESGLEMNILKLNMNLCTQRFSALTEGIKTKQRISLTLMKDINT